MVLDENTEEVMISLGIFVYRVVHSTKKHPQIGYVNFKGQRRKAYIGFWNDCPVWKLADDENDEQYKYCAEKTMPIEEDPDYIGDEPLDQGIEVTVLGVSISS